MNELIEVFNAQEPMVQAITGGFLLGAVFALRKLIGHFIVSMLALTAIIGGYYDAEISMSWKLGWMIGGSLVLLTQLVMLKEAIVSVGKKEA